MEHDARAVANEVISRAIAADRPVSSLKLTKLVYFCHAWMLALYDEPMLDEPVQAWLYGPVIPGVYDSVSRYGRMEIVSPINKAPKEAFSDAEKSIINQVWDIYGKRSDLQLSSIAHRDGTPWHQIWNAKGAFATIPDDLIRSHYKAIKAKAIPKTEHTYLHRPYGLEPFGVVAQGIRRAFQQGHAD